MKSLFFALTLISLSVTLIAEPIKASPWEALTLEDLRFIQQTLKENTPNAVDENNSRFNVWLNEGFTQASEKAHHIESQKDVLSVVGFYISGFKDPHIDFRPTSQQSSESPDKIVHPTNLQWEIRPFADGDGAWISLPSFGAKNEERLAQMKKVISQLPSLRTKKFIVLDVRGNGGGQSFWGTQILEGIFGKGYIEGIIQNSEKGSYDEWRVSAGNLNELKTKYLPFVKTKAGEGSPLVCYIEETIKNMESELNKGHHGLAKATFQPLPPVTKMEPHPSLYSGKLILVTDGLCGSSCLTVVEEVLRLPNVLHIGLETSGYSPYVEARQVELPSKLGTLIFPMKVIRSNTKKPNEPYVPAIIYPGDINDTPQLTHWLENHLKR